MPINFYPHGIKFILKEKGILRKWIKIIIDKEKRDPGEINFIFCDDDYLLSLNKKHLDHDTYTDILTFDYSVSEGKKNIITADIFISIPRVKENSEKYIVSFETELKRVMVHGILHLCGCKDKTKREKKTMREKEENYLKLSGM